MYELAMVGITGFLAGWMFDAMFMAERRWLRLACGIGCPTQILCCIFWSLQVAERLRFLAVLLEGRM